MSRIQIDKDSEGRGASHTLVAEETALIQQIRQRAFELSQAGEVGGDAALENWFKAERDLLQVPEGHLTEKHGSFHLHVAVPGFNDKDLKVTALRDALIVSAQSSHKNSEKAGDAVAEGFGNKRIFRRFDLPNAIDVDRVHATFEDGVLAVTASKVEKSHPRSVTVSTAA